MPIIKIDNKDYDTDNLSEEAKKQLSALQVVDAEIRHLQVQMGIAQTARSVHVQLLKAALVDPFDGDTIKLG
jgi:hypothetical protein